MTDERALALLKAEEKKRNRTLGFSAAYLALAAITAALEEADALAAALEALDEAVSVAIKPADGPHKVHWRGHTFEGPAADCIYSIFMSVQKLARQALKARSHAHD